MKERLQCLGAVSKSVDIHHRLIPCRRSLFLVDKGGVDPPRVFSGIHVFLGPLSDLLLVVVQSGELLDGRLRVGGIDADPLDLVGGSCSTARGRASMLRVRKLYLLVLMREMSCGNGSAVELSREDWGGLP